MSLTSASSHDDIVAAYVDNSDYADGAGDVSKARAFVQSCRILLIKRPSSAAHGPESASFDMRLLREEMLAAQSWLNANDSTLSAGRVRFASFENIR